MQITQGMHYFTIKSRIVHRSPVRVELLLRVLLANPAPQGIVGEKEDHIGLRAIRHSPLVLFERSLQPQLDRVLMVIPCVRRVACRYRAACDLMHVLHKYAACSRHRCRAGRGSSHPATAVAVR